ncbi:MULTISPECIES: glycine zipper family protein [unclassified Chryseobacterium]|uniref:glycine zipper family protein n=1 Tax=unclassified Chryseobacterium TaxID=2593645 RepID=UPI00100B6B20|nr:MULTISPECIES: glycine zipper family protein [unclassified Chryseobacterium]RXM50759.1 hypothetical protein BOQ64_16920 [Chryseobacterium sp. CH25]RXM62758.1 hypothetical protein BOQ60_20205 [Chryseobacterium sp. CH1]
MKKVFFFLMMAVSLSAQKTEVVELKQSIKDRKGTTKSITVIDNRSEKEIGNIPFRKETYTLKFGTDDLKNYIEDWFSKDNKVKGNNDIVLMLEDVKAYNENPEDKTSMTKIKFKFSSFIKRNNKYYFLNRIQNVITSDSNFPKYIASQISNAVTGMIKESYVSVPLGGAMSEEDLTNYEKYITENSPLFGGKELKDGVYKDFRSFYEQKPEPNYVTDKNKKGRVTNIKDTNATLNEEVIDNKQVFGYIENGKAYRSTPAGYLEMIKDDRGFYVVATKAELFPVNNGTGAMIGAMTGGLLGAVIGAAIDSGSSRRGKNVDTSGMPNVYMDSLTGSYIFD